MLHIKRRVADILVRWWGPLIVAPIMLVVILAALLLIIPWREPDVGSPRETNENSAVLENSRSSQTDHKRSPNDYFTVVKEVEKMGTLTRVAVKRSGDGEIFSAFWTEPREPRLGEKVVLISYTYFFSPGSQQLIAFAYPVAE